MAASAKVLVGAWTLYMNMAIGVTEGKWVTDSERLEVKRWEVGRVIYQVGDRSIT